MVDSFTLFVARGAQVPVLDRRLRAHVQFQQAVLQDERPAPADAGSTEQPTPEQSDQSDAK